MESPHPDERPHKKRRFFQEEEEEEESSVAPPLPQPSSNGDLAGFDADTLQAVVGNLPHATVLKLKEVSGGDVQRGTDNDSSYL